MIHQLKILTAILFFPILFVLASFDKDDLVNRAWKDASQGNISAITFLMSSFCAIGVWIFVLLFVLVGIFGL